MTGHPDRSFTIDTHHHIVPDFFWQATENAHAPVGGLAPLRWSKEASISFMDDAGIDLAVVSLSTPGVHTGDSAKARALTIAIGLIVKMSWTYWKSSVKLDP